MGAKSFHYEFQILVSKCILSLNTLDYTDWLIRICDKLLQFIEIVYAEDTNIVLMSFSFFFRFPTDVSNVTYIISVGNLKSCMTVTLEPLLQGKADVLPLEERLPRSCSSIFYIVQK